MGAAGTFLSDLRIVLRGRDFRRLFATRLVSQLGDGAFQVGLASLFFFSPERAATAGGVAAAFTVAVLPYTVVGPFAGVLLDRWRRRQILVAANLVRAGLVGLVSIVVATDSALPLVYLLALSCLSVNRFFLAGLGASLPHVVPRHELVMANSVSPTSGTLAAFVGVALGSVVRFVLGPGAGTDTVVVLVSGALYLSAALLATRMHPELLGPDPVDAVRPDGGSPTVPASTSAGSASTSVVPATPPVATRTVTGPWSGAVASARGVVIGLAEGSRHVWQRRPALHALAAIGAHRFAYGTTTLLTVLLCRNHFADPADVDAGLRLLASVLAASGLGVGVAALVTPLATQRLPASTWITLCYAVAAAVQAAFVVVFTVPVAVVGAFLLGVAAQGSKICVDAIVQAEVDDAFRGRVMSFYDVIFNVAFVAAAATSALAVAVGSVPPDGYSPRFFAGVGLLYALTAAGYHHASLRRTERPPVPPGDPGCEVPADRRS
ncbi:MAG: MFS transporter [Actinomycetales bacterium]|nr:MFS transporter [Actinomycetales bacterium]